MTKSKGLVEENSN